MQNTIQNLAKAFIGESQARNRYTMYSKIAKKEGYEQIAEIFLLLFIYLMYQLRQDASAHRVEYQEIVKQMFDVVNKNTESNTKLSEAVKELSYGCHYRSK